ncbi:MULTISPECIES: glutathione-disulfide reductase [unclassified Chelatococcus]|uniref:glutathione-disulfide reductase n=1 Tax=unclassified Chelatococcus TaxID=2638111 RepID=UPI001BD19D9A|nr:MULTISPECIES: glutathione-disulfide reductase [unclassified Chelatococcus]CAH1670280.1 Glutathione reductase [Hyphomicrobiales bacterium]MBS7739227.1 glutathione-disulfide reductase [Chelatococcus sp. HY11]MBX3543717.1 glutathione-disulfide reductase [Chelatococcus sp.]MCO5076240.1 glutathione-disulfide reductase [Chelatococcus sp.]CAH1677536.1 Glutathione reductase [Hyphomicrobiales bacterium]
MTTGDFDVDLFVIGAGSGGVRAGRIAAGYGARVMIAEESRVGGTCVIRGCVPKKLYVYASRFQDAFADAAGFGWNVPEAHFHWPTLVANKETEITRLEGIYRRNLVNAGVEIVDSRAVVEGPNTVRLLATGESISAKVILIATGARPSLEPMVQGGELGLVSDQIFDLPELPRRLLVIGGGYIAVEFAGVFAGLGVETTLLHRGPRLLRGFDHDLAEGLAAAYRARGIELLLERRVERLDRAGSDIGATLSDGTTRRFDQVLVATGRKPHTSGLGLETAGVATNEKGAVIVDGDGRTNVPSIYAVGDVTDRANLTPVAIREGHAFADTVFGNKSTRVDHSLIPTAVFSTPELGTIGPSEEAARALYPKLVVYRTRFRAMKATLSGRDEPVMMKILVDGETDKVIGVHIMGEAAGEMIQLVGIAVTMGATKADFDRTIAVHPTAAEELVTLRTPVG